MERNPIQFYTIDSKKKKLSKAAKEKGITLTTLINNILDAYIKKNKL